MLHEFAAYLCGTGFSARDNAEIKRQLELGLVVAESTFKSGEEELRCESVCDSHTFNEAKKVERHWKKSACGKMVLIAASVYGVHMDFCQTGYVVKVDPLLTR
jgi:hypothetical protein